MSFADDIAKVPPERIKSVIDRHVRMYERRVAKGKEGHRSINLKECEHYLFIWKSIQAKNGDLTKLEAIEKHELQDAYYSGEFEYDDYEEV